MEQVPDLGLTYIRCHCTKYNHDGNLPAEICVACVNTFTVTQNCGKNYLPHVYISHKVIHIKYNSSSLNRIPNFSLNLTQPTHNAMSHLNWYQLCTYCIFIHSFIYSTGMCTMQRFLAILRSFFHSSLLCTYPATLLHKLYCICCIKSHFPASMVRQSLEPTSMPYSVTC